MLQQNLTEWMFWFINILVYKHFINNQNVLPGAGSPRSRGCGQVLVKVLSWAENGQIPAGSSCGGRGKGSPGAPFI